MKSLYLYFLGKSFKKRMFAGIPCNNATNGYYKDISRFGKNKNYSIPNIMDIH